MIVIDFFDFQFYIENEFYIPRIFSIIIVLKTNEKAVN